jgi:Holliday junction resolvase
LNVKQSRKGKIHLIKQKIIKLKSLAKRGHKFFQEKFKKGINLYYPALMSHDHPTITIERPKRDGSKDMNNE